MNRRQLATATFVIGITGLLSLYALPWVAISIDDSTNPDRSGTTFESYAVLMARADRPGTSPEQTEVANSLGFIFHGFLWGSILAAVAVAGYAIRPVHRGAGDAFAAAGTFAVFTGIFLILGHVFFLVDVSDLNRMFAAASTDSFRASAWWGVNYLTPVLAVAFMAVSTIHAARTIPEVISGLPGERPVPVDNGRPRGPSGAGAQVRPPPPPRNRAPAPSGDPSPSPGAPPPSGMGRDPSSGVSTRPHPGDSGKPSGMGAAGAVHHRLPSARTEVSTSRSFGAERSVEHSQVTTETPRQVPRDHAPPRSVSTRSPQVAMAILAQARVHADVIGARAHEDGNPEWVSWVERTHQELDAMETSLHAGRVNVDHLIQEVEDSIIRVEYA